MNIDPIPIGWAFAKLPEVAEINMGQSPSSSDVNEFEDGIAFFQGKAEFGKLYPSVKKYCTDPKKIAEADDILLSVRAPVGPTNLANRTTAIGRGLAAIRADKENINFKFLLHYFRKIEPWMSEQGTGTTFKAISGQFLKNLDCCVPPLAEQKVIADKLDTLLAQVENTKARLKRIPNILKRFRQSVLAAAVSGKLTEGWRDLNPTDAVMPSLGKEKFKTELYEIAKDSLPHLPASWLVVPAADVLSYVTSGSRGWSNYYAESGDLFLRMTNVRYDTTKLDLDDLQYVDLPEHVEGKRSLVQYNDLLVSITADVGRVAHIDRDLDEAYVNQHLALLRPTNEINSEFLATCITSRNVGLKQVDELKRGATKAGLGLDDIRSLAIPFPSREEQTEIVRRVEQLFAYANTIEQQVQAALTRVNNLTQSILAKAFRGELTADWRVANPELISGENSAEALLEKIKAEREALKKQPKTKRNSANKKTGNTVSKQTIDVLEALK
jgi:type I restriction enzyme S subunit